MKTVFLAGPYRGRGEPGEIERNIEQSKRFQSALAHAGIVAYSPNIHDIHWETLNGGSEAAAKTLRKFTQLVLEEITSALVVMPGWENSTGSKVEIEFSQRKGIPIFYPKDETDLTALKTWYNTVVLTDSNT